MTNKELNKYFDDILNKNISLENFEIWLKDNPQFEKQIGIELYCRIIYKHFEDKEFELRLRKLVEDNVDFAKIHKEDILRVLKSFTYKRKSPLELLSKLHSYAELGYDFLAENEFVGNFGEQGKSIILLLDSMELSTQWKKLREIDTDFISEINQIIKKINSKKIIFTGERRIGDYNQISFTYIEKD